MNKRGLSPIVATALLIMIALVLAALLFFWARGLLTEQNQKFGTAIEHACADVSFQAEAFVSATGGTISILNRGNVPLYAVDVRIEDTEAGMVAFVKTFRDESEGKEVTIPQGSTAQIVLDPSETTLHVGNTLIIQPVLLGSKGGQSEIYVCREQALRITVASA